MNDEQVKQLQAGLDPSHVAKRKGFGGGGMLSYIEGHVAIDTANRIFGFDGWSYEILEVACIGETSGKVAYRATVKLTVNDTVRVDVGYGDGSNKSNILAAHELALKESVTDALKRCLRSFGNQFGNSLYQKDNPLHSGSADAKAPKMEEEDSTKMLATLSLVVQEAKTLEKLKIEMGNFGADARSMLPAHYADLREQASQKMKELS